MRISLVFIVGLLASCGVFDKDETPVNPTTCKVEDVSEGVRFTCIDKDGQETSGVVNHGQAGGVGERGPQGERGVDGVGLSVVSEIRCSGAIEGWLEDSYYDVAFSVVTFETGDRFARSIVKLQRGGETINIRSGAAFYLKDFPHTVVNDGLLNMRLSGDSLEVTSEGGIDATLSCEVQK
jgi:hypothetical protein